MARFGFRKGQTRYSENMKSEKVKALPTKTVNSAGGTNFKITDPSERLLHIAAAGFFNQDTFYDAKGNIDSLTGNAKELIETAVEVATRKDGFHKDLVQIANWLRNEAQNRLTPQVLMAIAAKMPQTKPFVREYTQKTVQRADEIRTLFAMWNYLFGVQSSGKPYIKASVPNSLKRGLMDCFVKFPPQLILKYHDTRTHPTFGDVLRSVDLNRKGRQYKRYWNPDLYGYLMANVLPDSAKDSLPEVWARKKFFEATEFTDEVKRLTSKGGIMWNDVASHFGSTKETWEWAAYNAPHMALMKNLRNMAELGISPAAATKAAERIKKPELLLQSRQYPYEFLSAYAELGGQINRYDNYGKEIKIIGGAWLQSTTTSTLKRAIVQALDTRVDQLPKISGTTVFIYDLSGSMRKSVSEKSVVQLVDIAAVQTAIGIRQCEHAIAIPFGDIAVIREVNPDDTIISNAIKLAQNGPDRESFVGHSSMAGSAIALLSKKGIKVDRIIVYSDMQVYGSRNVAEFAEEWQNYKHHVNPDAHLHSVNLAGTIGSIMPNEDPKTHLISGFNEKQFEMMLRAESTNQFATEGIDKAEATLNKEFLGSSN